MKRADKIRLAEEARSKEAQADNRDAKQREEARNEWGRVRKTCREAFLAGGDWNIVLEQFKQTEGFYSDEERERMCRAYADELIRQTI